MIATQPLRIVPSIQGEVVADTSMLCLEPGSVARGVLIPRSVLSQSESVRRSRARRARRRYAVNGYGFPRLSYHGLNREQNGGWGNIQK